MYSLPNRLTVKAFFSDQHFLKLFTSWIMFVQRFTSRQLEFSYLKSQNCRPPYRIHNRQHVRKEVCIIGYCNTNQFIIAGVYQRRILRTSRIFAEFQSLFGLLYSSVNEIGHSDKVISLPCGEGIPPLSP